MRTVSIFTKCNRQIIRLPKDMEYQGVTNLQITKNGDIITLSPARPNWLSLAEALSVNDNFL